MGIVNLFTIEIYYIRLLLGHCQPVHMNADTQILLLDGRVSCDKNVPRALQMAAPASKTRAELRVLRWHEQEAHRTRLFFPPSSEHELHDAAGYIPSERLYFQRSNFSQVDGRTVVCLWVLSSAVRVKESLASCELRAFRGRRPWRGRKELVRLTYRFWYSVRLLIGAQMLH